MDDRRQRLIVDRSLPEGQRYFGWEVADAAALDALAARLEAGGVAVTREPAALADQRFVAGLISFADPSGNRLEAFHGAQIADEPFRPGRSISGFRTGPLGMGHAVLMVTNIDTALPFYRDLLGFRISDFIRTPITAYFLHVNPRHHSLALFEAPHTGMHHLMVELYSFDDVARATTSRSARRTASSRRWAGIRTTWSPRSICTRHRTSWWNTAGAASRWTMRPGSRRRWRASPASGAITGCSMAWDPTVRRRCRRSHEPRAPLQVMEGNYHRMTWRLPVVGPAHDSACKRQRIRGGNQHAVT